MRYSLLILLLATVVFALAQYEDSSSSETQEIDSSDSLEQALDSQEAEIDISEGSGSGNDDGEVVVQGVKIFGVLPGPGDIRKRRGLPGAYEIRK